MRPVLTLKRSILATCEQMGRLPNGMVKVRHLLMVMATPNHSLDGWVRVTRPRR